MRSAADAFLRGASPEAFSLERRGERARGQIAFAFDPPAVHHLELVPAAPGIRHETIPERGPRGSVAQALVELLQAPSLDEALEVAQDLLDALPSGDEQRRRAEAAIALAVGREPLPARWGDDPVADWLRARLVDATDECPSWLGVLTWLGRHAQHWLRSPEALDEMPLAAAALATTQGLPRTLARVMATTLRETRRRKDWAGLLRVLILRCALEGAFDPESLRRGIVPTPRRGGEVVAEDWKPLLLARRALTDAGHVVGAAHLTAALVATDVRRGVMADFRLRGLNARVPSWGSRSLDEKEAGKLHAALYEPGRHKTASPSHLPSAPWPSGWGGPDTHGFTYTLWRLMGGDSELAREVFLHDGLAVAAVYALGGHTMNAMAALGASRTPDVFYRSRAALSAAIHVGTTESTLPKDLPSKEADAVYRQLRELPEPNLALETPYCVLGDQRAEAQHAFQTSGRLQEFRRLRLVLDRPDLAESLAPFWLLADSYDIEDSLRRLVRLTVAGLAPPTADECGRFLRSIE